MSPAGGAAYDSATVRGWLLTPAAPASAAKGALVTVIHGGPSAAYEPRFIGRGRNCKTYCLASRALPSSWTAVLGVAIATTPKKTTASVAKNNAQPTTPENGDGDQGEPGTVPRATPLRRRRVA